MNRLADVTSALSFVRRGSESGRDEPMRYPLRRVDSLLHRFFKVFQINLDRMKQHKLNIQKFQAENSISELTKEYMYTLQSVHQLTITVEQIKQIRSQIEIDDLAALDCRLVSLFNGAILLLAEFLLLDSSEHTENTSSSCSTKLRRAHSTSDDAVRRQRAASRLTFTCRQQSVEQLFYATEMDCVQAWAQLKLKLLDFHDSMQKLFLLIETHSSTEADLPSDQPVTPAESSSFKLSNLKCLVMPMAGAVLGGALGGPVGIVAGLKAAKVAAFGGGILGLTGGTVMKKNQDSQQEVGPTVDRDNVLDGNGQTACEENK